MLDSKINLTCQELSQNEMVSAFSVLSHMYPNMSESEYSDIIYQRISEGYRMVGVFADDKIICAAGFWIGVRFYCGKFIQIDNMVTLPQYQSEGAGKQLTEWIKQLGKKEQCSRIILDSYVENFDAHRFFLREGFIIRGYHLNYTL